MPKQYRSPTAGQNQPALKVIQNPPAKTVGEALENNQAQVNQAKQK